jgi:hypothetical protein
MRVFTVAAPDAENLRCFINRLLMIVNEVDNLPMFG